MPRGQKSKVRAREKRRQAREESKMVNDAQSTGAKEESPCSLSSENKDAPHGSSAAAFHDQQEPERVSGTMAAAAKPVSSTSSNKGAKSQVQENLHAPEPWSEDPLKEKILVLVSYMLYKYQVKEPISKREIIINVVQTYKNHFSEILKKASDYMELVFGLEVKEVDPKKRIYVLINMLDIECETVTSDTRGIPMTGLLMTVLGVILTKNKCAPEKEVWKVLNNMGIDKEREHFIFGDAKKVFTHDLVKQRYLEYQQVPDSNPPSYQFLWGPRAYAETTKMKVLEFVAKIHGSVASAFQPWYEEALKDEKERAQARARSRARSAATAGSHSKVMSTTSSCPK